VSMSHESVCVRPTVSYARRIPVSEVILPESVTSDPDRMTGIYIICQSVSCVFQTYSLYELHTLFMVHGSWFIFIYAISAMGSRSSTVTSGVSKL
jgi:hypothetical protein